MAEERAQSGLQYPMNLQRILVNHVGFTPSAGKRVVVLDPQSRPKGRMESRSQ